MRKNIQVVLERSRRVFYRGVWSILCAASGGTPPITTLQERSIGSHPDDQEFVCSCAGPAYLDPEWGYLVTQSGCLIEKSLLPNFRFKKRPWRVGIPSPFPFLIAKRSSSASIVRYPSIISLRHLWEWNYYHFYADVLGKLSLLDSLGVDRSTPIVLGRYALELPFVQQVIRRGELAERNWIIADHSYVLADEIIYCRTKHDLAKRIDYAVEQMNAPRPVDPESGERVFLNRGTKVTRRIHNLSEILPVLNRYGFKVVDSSEMRVDEQVNLFSHSRFLVGIHGAGLTNIIFRRDGKFSLLELHSEEFPTRKDKRGILTDFRTISEAYGYAWDHLSGPSCGGNPIHCDFTISPEQLDEKIARMVSPD